MSFILQVDLHPERLPDLPALRDTASGRLGLVVRFDEETVWGLEQGVREAEWCRWPRPMTGLFVPGATTRGVELDAGHAGATVQVRVTIPALATWADWRLGLTLAGALGALADGGVRVVGEGSFVAAGLVQLFEDDDGRYLAETAAGASALAEAIAEGRVVRVGGPGGYAIVGPRTWLEVQKEVEGDPTELPLALVERIQASVELRGFEDFHVANPLQLDGPSGQAVAAAVLSPDRSTVLRDPQYVLMSDDIEAEQAAMWLLPFAQLDDAFPARALWIDDRTAAIPAIPGAAWRRELDRIRPLLVRVEDLLDS
jgi:hypothetical protein